MFKCDLFESSLCFTNITELTSVLELISKCTSKVSTDYDWQLGGSDYTYVKKEIGNGATANSSQKVYSSKLHASIKESIEVNAKLKKDYEVKLKEYTSSVNESKDINEEIRGEWKRVLDKYRALDDLCFKMKYDYMPLANNDETIALNFLIKAYPMDSDEIVYVQEHYSDC